ncbi:MAG: hypothetical protein GY944_22065 [bacterium]|nr:hypothetical protein [bacterium]
MSSKLAREHTPTPASAWTWAVLWALLVWGLGGEDLSLDNTSRILGPLIRWLLPGISEGASNQLQLVIRKTAHVAEYAVLSLLVFRALLAGRGLPLQRSAITAFILATAFAAADETRQSFSITRLGSAWDVALDAGGAAVGIGLGLWLRTRWPGLGEALGIVRIERDSRSTGDTK